MDGRTDADGTSWWQRLLAAGFPAAVGANLALGLFLANADELDGRLPLVQALVLCLDAWVVLFLLLQLGKGVGRAVWLAASAYALFFLVRDVLFPLPLAELDGESGPWQPDLGYVSAELATFAAALAGLWLLRRHRFRLTSAMTLVFLAWAGLNALAHRHALGWGGGEPGPMLAIPAPTAQSGQRPDIYHILFDSYQTVEHQFIRRQKGPAPFGDFICYQNNISNYTRTWLSIPSLFTGTWYSPEQNVRDWASSFEREGLVPLLKEHGYQVRVFGPNHHWWRTPLVDYRRTTPEIAAQRLQQAEAEQTFLPLLALRGLPSLAGGPVHGWLSAGAAADLPPASEKAYYCAIKFREMLAGIRHTPEGGQYTFIHMLLPHGPCVLDAEGNYVGSRGTRHAANLFLERLVGELVAELKRLKRYDSSLIVIHADTGCVYDVDLDSQELVGRSALRPARHAMTDADWIDGCRFELEVVKARVNAALLIKPIRHRGYQVVDVPSQLTDLAPTILGQAGIAPRPGQFPAGCDLLAAPPVPDRLRRCYIIGNPRGGRYVPHFQEYLVRHNHFEKGDVLPLRGRDR
jgi:hypothetical protein